MDKGDKLKKWEIALMLSLCLTLCHGLGWWGVIFPGLTGDISRETVETVRLDRDAGEVQVRFQFWEWLQSLFS